MQSSSSISKAGANSASRRTSRRLWCAAAIVLLVLVIYASLRVGVTGALARSAYVQSIFLREEHKCFVSGDVECFRAQWAFRAAIMAEQSRIALKSTIPSGVEQELKEFVQWQEKMPEYPPPQKK